MTRVKIRSSPASEAWQGVMTAFTRVNRLLAKELEAETSVSLEWYSILLMLALAAGTADVEGLQTVFYEY